MSVSGGRPTFDYDLAIVGGGPAGTSTALHLVRRNRIRPERIVLVDKATFPRDKPCAGAISQLGIDVLSALGVSIEVPSIEMKGVRILAGDVVGETFEPMGICVRREELDTLLLRTVERDGVHVREGRGLRGLDRIDGGFRLTVAGDEAPLTARYVVAADGAGSTTRKLLRIREPDRKGHLYVLDSPLTDADTSAPRGLVDFDLGILADGLEGYYWDFPTPLGGGLQVSRGIYHANLSRPDTPAGESVKDVLRRSLARRGVDITKVTLRPFSTRPFVRGSTTWAPGVLLVGEACGIDQTTGEGIAQAIDMGRIAAFHLARALRTGERRFFGYDAAVRGSMTGKHLLQSAFLARRVYGRLGGPAQRFLLRSTHARAAGVKWYRGEPLGLGTQLKLGVGLLASLV